MRNNRSGLGVSTDLGRAYSNAERDMMNAFACTRSDLIAIESPKDTWAGARAPMDGMIMTCNRESMTTEVAYIYEAKCRNFDAATLFGKYGGRAILGSVKLGNAQRASILFGVPTLLFMRLLDETFFLVKQITNGDGSFTFRYNEKYMRVKRPCQSGFEWAWQTFVPMDDAEKSPLKL